MRSQRIEKGRYKEGRLVEGEIEKEIAETGDDGEGRGPANRLQIVVAYIVVNDRLSTWC